MARIFTTSFEFNHQNYEAIVTAVLHNGEWNFTVRMLDEELACFLPEGQIVYSGIRGYEQLESLNNTIARSILRSLSHVIEKHLFSPVS